MFDSNKGDPPSVQIIPAAGPGYRVLGAGTLILFQVAINGKTYSPRPDNYCSDILTAKDPDQDQGCCTILTVIKVGQYLIKFWDQVPSIVNLLSLCVNYDLISEQHLNRLFCVL